MSDRFLIAGEYRLDLLDERLWRGGEAVRVGGKAFALLRALMERPQTLLTKDELFDRVWPGLAVSESVLTTAVKELRRALGDDARRPTVIETVHGRGYRFVLPVERGDAPASSAALVPISDAPALAGPVAPDAPPSTAAAPPPRRRGWLIAAAAASLAAVLLWLALATPLRAPSPRPDAPLKSIAVLPFDDFSPGTSQRWFAQGLTQEILTSLMRTPDLRVASRQSSARLSAQNADPLAVARALGVAHVLEGSVRRVDGRVRVTAELIRAADGVQLWSATYDRPARDVISIQEDIAYAIASALRTVMDPAKLRAMVAAGTRSVEAYEAYLSGLAFDQRQFDEGDIAHARAAADAYEQARRHDPGFAAAHWRAAATWFGNVTRVDASVRDERPEGERLARFFERVDMAIATSRDDTERLKYRAAHAAMRLRFVEAHRLMARYLALRPRDIDAWEEMADLAAYAGERGWMARAAERIHSLSMAEGDPRSRAITVSVMALRLDEAATRARQQLAVRPENALTLYQAHRALIWTGRVGEAEALLAPISASALPDHTKKLAALRQACAEGRGEDALVHRASIDRAGKLSARWQAAQIIGDEAGAARLLLPLDEPSRLPTLMQFLIHPTFDSTRYPKLSATLARDRVARAPSVAMPFACGTGGRS